jgi:hypothetical protein
VFQQYNLGEAIRAQVRDVGCHRLRDQLSDRHCLLYEERAFSRYLHALPVITQAKLTFLGTAFRDLKTDKLYHPTIGMKKPGETLRANFGQEPFAFDIDKMVQVRKGGSRRKLRLTYCRRRRQLSRPKLPAPGQCTG